LLEPPFISILLEDVAFLFILGVRIRWLVWEYAFHSVDFECIAVVLHFVSLQTLRYRVVSKVRKDTFPERDGAFHNLFDDRDHGGMVCGMDVVDIRGDQFNFTIDRDREIGRQPLESLR
jgi:hypothetical protein